MKFEDYFEIIGTYELKDGFYNVDGDVYLIKILEKLPVKFGKVKGGFYCHGNKLTSLKGAPKQVVGDFFCHSNNLNSLEGAPKQVGGDFCCDKNLHNTKEYIQFKILEKLRS